MIMSPTFARFLQGEEQLRHALLKEFWEDDDGRG